MYLKTCLLSEAEGVVFTKCLVTHSNLRNEFVK